jgi:hypothetical protein
MKNTNKLLLCFLFNLLPTLAFSYPIYIRIENPRAHPLVVVDQKEQIKITIPEQTNKEFMLWCENDYRVIYKSGMSGKVAKPNLDDKLSTFINLCKDAMGANWDKRTVKYCILQLAEKEASVMGKTYTLKVVGIRDLNIPFIGENKCSFSDNEKALKLVPVHPGFPLLTTELKALSMLLYGKCD